MPKRRLYCVMVASHVPIYILMRPFVLASGNLHKSGENKIKNNTEENKYLMALVSSRGV